MNIQKISFKEIKLKNLKILQKVKMILKQE